MSIVSIVWGVPIIDKPMMFCCFTIMLSIFRNKINIWNVNRARATEFIFDPFTNGYSCENVEVLEKENVSLSFDIISRTSQHTFSEPMQA